MIGSMSVQHLAHARVVQVDPRHSKWKSERGAASAGTSSSCTIVPASDADRVGVELVGAVEVRLERDEQADDHEVPDERRERRDREVVVGVEDPDDEPVEAEQQHDREQHLRQADHEVVERRREVSPVSSGMIHGATTMKKTHDRRQRGDDDHEERRRELERLALAALLEQLGEDRHERRADSAASANSERTRFGTWKANVNAENGPLVPK